jgi:hypothetical protein
MTAQVRVLTVVVLAVAASVLCGRAEARDHGGIRISIGGPVYPAPVVAVPAVERRYVPGHYESRTETVLVQPAHYERISVAPVYETRYDRWRRPYTVCIREGGYRDVYVPARYENRVVSAWAPGYWQEIPVAAPVFAAPPVCHPVAVYQPRPWWDVGFSFRF